MVVPFGAQRPSIADADFRALVDGIPHIAWIAAPNGSTEFLNRQGARYAQTPDESARRVDDWVTLVHPTDAELAVRAWKHAIRRRTDFHVDCRIRRWDGVYRWHAFRALPVCDEFGVVVKWMGTAVDVDDEKAMQADLQFARRKAAETLALLETLQANAPVGFGFVDREFRRVRVNETLAGYNGSTVAEQIGQPTAALVPLMWSQLQPLYQAVLDTGRPLVDMEVVGPSEANPWETRYWLNSYYPVALDDEVIGIGIVAVEITERRRAEQAFRELSAIVSSSGDAIFGSTIDGVVTSWNPAAETLFGWTAEEMVGQPVAILAPEGLHAEQRALVAAVMSGGPTQRLDTKRLRKGGTLVDVHIAVSTVADDSGAIVGLSAIIEDITERVEAQRAVEVSQRRLAEAQRIAEMGSFELDVVTGELAWSTEHFRILGLDPSLSPSVDLLISLIHPDDRDELIAARKSALEQPAVFDRIYRIIRPDGQLRWVHSRSVAEVDDAGRVVRLIGTLRDRTDRIEEERARHAANRRFETGFEQGGIGAGIMNLDGIPIRVNAAVCALLGRPAELLTNRSWLEYGHPDDFPLGPAVEARLAAGHDTYADERRYLRPDGSIVWASVHITLVRDEAGKPSYFLAQLQDIHERKAMEAELVHQALHDSLTGLANRTLLTDRLTHGLAGTRQRQSRLAVIFLDLDDFKAVNDSMGHTAGDELLRLAATRIAAAIRPSDTLARFGGDEFVVVCEDASAEDAEDIAERLRTALSRPFRVGTKNVHVTASLGTVVADDDATPESLLADSDAAMYVAKGLGRDRTAVFDHALRSKAQQRIATVSDLHRALEREEFAVHFQPVIDLTTGAMISAEALLRWEHPDRGFISPVEFIPLAEDTGLIIPIGAWVLERACERLVEWRRTAPMMSLAVNLSVRQMLARDITEVIEQIVTRTGAPASSLCLELTESVFMKDADYFGATLARIKSLGVTLSIDDFGTGYSSLAYLKQFPVDAVKIDRSFVDGLGTDPHDTALVQAILAMAGALELGVTAEGVETRQQLTMLKEMGCQRAQGFFIARPLPGPKMDRLVVSGYRWSVD